MSGITVGRVGDELIAVKRADPDDPRRRRAEADLLSRLDHPGIVHLVAFVDGDPAELRTRYVGTDTWARTPPTTDDAIVAGLAAVAATIADLHAAGTNHGALRAEHVLIGPDRHPVLCGLADARPLDASAEADDLLALAGLIRELSATTDDRLRLDLADLADRAAGGELTARRLADEVHGLADRPPAEPVRRWSRRTMALATMVAVVGAAVVTVAVARPQPSPEITGPTPELPTTVPSTAVPPTTLPPTTVPSTAVPPSTVPATTPVRPSPPPSLPPPTTSVASTPGVELVHDGRRYGLGAPGDIVVLGDWDCDGAVTPALLRLDDHTVAMFDRWPEPDATVAAQASSVVPDAVGLEAVEEGGCHRLRVIEPTGSLFFTPEA